MQQPTTITRALVALKTLDDRINRAIKNGTFGAVQIGTVVPQSFDPIAAENSVNDLINQRSKTKSAIMKSNLVTKVTIAGTEMTIMDAIELKTTIHYDRMLKQELERDLADIETAILKGEQLSKTAADNALKAALAANPNMTGEEIAQLMKSAGDAYKAVEVKVNGFDLRTKIDALDKKITEFLADVDAALSESNAITQINI